MAKSKYIETLEEQYTKKDGKSVLRYKAPDNKWRYIQTSKDASGGNPMPSGGGMVEVKWQELKDKRDVGKLIPGSLYRITDYQCTTTQENTQSAGHQFDIVLLALSGNKLAEEGWAMMHDNIYDMTFADGVRKVYILKNDDNECNIVDVETLLGFENYIYHTDDGDPEVEVNWENHTATDLLGNTFEQALTEENLPYNYFQNSNLSAWKVWYCLDNDKSRFAWADDSVDEGSPASIKININNVGECVLSRISNNDQGIYKCWVCPNPQSPHAVLIRYTTEEIPTTSSKVYYKTYRIEETSESIIEVNPAHEGTGLPNGRGVIYRLIDEWNIDYPCDFKNMQMLIPMDGEDNINMENPVRYKYCYAFTDNTSGEPEDLSIKGHAFNIKVKANLVVEDSTIYISPRTLFYKKREELIFHFSDITVGTANNAIFINHGRAINILDGSNNIILITCVNISIGNDSNNVMLNAVSNSTFGSNCKNIQLANVGGLNYGNNGVELATKS